MARANVSAGPTIPMPLVDNTKPYGLGFDFDEDRRQSASDDSTLEIATPTTMRPVKGVYPGYGVSLDSVSKPTSIPETHHALATPTSAAPISSAFMQDSNDTSPESRQSDSGRDEHASDDGMSRSPRRCMHNE